MIKKQQHLIIILTIIVVVAIAAYFLILMPILSKEEAAEDAPSLQDGEVLGSNNRILIMEHVEKVNIQEIEVHNQYGNYAVYRAEDGEFYIKDAEIAPYSKELLSSLIVSAGYTLSMTRVSENAENLKEYGLDPSDNPAWYKLTKRDGTEHTVYIGAKIPTGAGYYAKYSTRNAVYILDSSIETTLLADLKTIITPILTLPVPQNEYFSITNFMLVKDGEPFIKIDSLSEEDKQANASTSIFKMTYPGDYTPSSTNYDTVLRTFIGFQGTETVEFGLTDEIIAKYGFDKPAYEIYFEYKGVQNNVMFSKKNEDGSYYACSLIFDIISKVDSSVVPFLEWDLIQFVDRPIFQMNINDIAKVVISSDSVNETFLLEGEAQELVVTQESNSTKPEVANFRQLYKTMLTIQLEDYAALPEGQELKEMATMTVVTRKGIKNEYKFYPYSTRRAYYTVNGNGEFYVLRDMVTKLISDTEKVIKGIQVDSDAKN